MGLSGRRTRVRSFASGSEEWGSNQLCDLEHVISPLRILVPSPIRGPTDQRAAGQAPEQVWVPRGRPFRDTGQQQQQFSNGVEVCHYFINKYGSTGAYWPRGSCAHLQGRQSNLNLAELLQGCNKTIPARSLAKGLAFQKILVRSDCSHCNEAEGAIVKEGLGGRSGFSVPGSTALSPSEISELHITGGIQAVMADRTKIKGQAEACKAGFHNLRPCSLTEKKREIPPASLPAGKEEEGQKGGRAGQLCLYPIFI